MMMMTTMMMMSIIVYCWGADVWIRQSLVQSRGHFLLPTFLNATFKKQSSSASPSLSSSLLPSSSPSLSSPSSSALPSSSLPSSSSSSLLVAHFYHFSAFTPIYKNFIFTRYIFVLTIIIFGGDCNSNHNNNNDDTGDWGNAENCTIMIWKRMMTMTTVMLKMGQVVSRQVAPYVASDFPQAPSFQSSSSCLTSSSSSSWSLCFQQRPFFCQKPVKIAIAIVSQIGIGWKWSNQ